MNTYYVTLSNGTQDSRNSKRAYTHAVIVAGHVRDEDPTERVGVLAWCGSHKLAMAKARDGERRGFLNVQIVEVSTEAAPKPRLTARADAPAHLREQIKREIAEGRIRVLVPA